MKVVSNAGPLMALGKLGLVHLLHQLYGPVMIPTAVYDEVVTRGPQHGDNFTKKRDHVHLGGIIIGRDNKLIKPKRGVDLNQLTYLAKQAWEIREKVFYQHYKIELLTWDQIITRAKRHIISHQTKTGPSNTVIDLTNH